MQYCPHCGFAGTEGEVDEHRSTGVHNDEPQAGSNLSHRHGPFDADCDPFDDGSNYNHPLGD